MDYSEFKALLGEAKRSSDPLWSRFILRPISFPTGWFFYKIGMKANSISLLSILLAITSSLIMVFGSSDGIVLASFLMVLVALSDCIDGNVARARGETGPGGEWMDALSGYTVYALLPLTLGIHMYLHSPYAALPGLWIIVGAVTSIAGPDYYLHPHRAIHRNMPLEDNTLTFAADVNAPQMGKGSNSGSGSHPASSPTSGTSHFGSE